MPDTVTELSIPINEPYALGIYGYRNPITNVYNNSAIITGKLYDGATLVTTVTAVYVTGSNGNYILTLPHSITSTLDLSTTYEYQISVTGLVYRYLILKPIKRGMK